MFMKLDIETDTLCLFNQYIAKKMSIVHQGNQPALKLQHYNYSVLLIDNRGMHLSNRRFPLSYYDWISDSVFIESDIFEVNKLYCAICQQLIDISMD